MNKVVFVPLFLLLITLISAEKLNICQLDTVGTAMGTAMTYDETNLRTVVWTADHNNIFNSKANVIAYSTTSHKYDTVLNKTNEWIFPLVAKGSHLPEPRNFAKLLFHQPTNSFLLTGGSEPVSYEIKIDYKLNVATYTPWKGFNSTEKDSPLKIVVWVDSLQAFVGFNSKNAFFRLDWEHKKMIPIGFIPGLEFFSEVMLTYDSDVDALILMSSCDKKVFVAKPSWNKLVWVRANAIYDPSKISSKDLLFGQLSISFMTFDRHRGESLIYYGMDCTAISLGVTSPKYDFIAGNPSSFKMKPFLANTTSNPEGMLSLFESDTGPIKFILISAYQYSRALKTSLFYGITVTSTVGLFRTTDHECHQPPDIVPEWLIVAVMGVALGMAVFTLLRNEKNTISLLNPWGNDITSPLLDASERSSAYVAQENPEEQQDFEFDAKSLMDDHRFASGLTIEENQRLIDAMYKGIFAMWKYGTIGLIVVMISNFALVCSISGQVKSAYLTVGVNTPHFEEAMTYFGPMVGMMTLVIGVFIHKAAMKQYAQTKDVPMSIQDKEYKNQYDLYVCCKLDWFRVKRVLIFWLTGMLFYAGLMVSAYLPSLAAKTNNREVVQMIPIIQALVMFPLKKMAKMAMANVHPKGTLARMFFFTVTMLMFYLLGPYFAMQKSTSLMGEIGDPADPAEAEILNINVFLVTSVIVNELRMWLGEGLLHAKITPNCQPSQHNWLYNVPAKLIHKLPRFTYALQSPNYPSAFNLISSFAIILTYGLAFGTLSTTLTTLALILFTLTYWSTKARLSVYPPKYGLPSLAMVSMSLMCYLIAGFAFTSTLTTVQNHYMNPGYAKAVATVQMTITQAVIMYWFYVVSVLIYRYGPRYTFLKRFLAEEDDEYVKHFMEISIMNSY